MLRARSIDDVKAGNATSITSDVHVERPSAKPKHNFEEMFAAQCRKFGLPPFRGPDNQLRFAKDCQLFKSPTGRPRQWAFDFAFEGYKLAVEIEGIVVRRVWVAELTGFRPVERDGRIVNVKSVKPQTISMGRHATIDGMREDCKKYQAAAILGWTVIRGLQQEVKSEELIITTMRILQARGWKC